MTYRTILTSKGTTTIPVQIRHQLGIQPGMYVSFVQDEATGEIVLKRAQSIDEIRKMNQVALAQAATNGLDHNSIEPFSIGINENGTV